MAVVPGLTNNRGTSPNTRLDDDQVVAAAITARVDLIVSGDKHLLGPGSDYRGIRIVTPTEAIPLIGS